MATEERARPVVTVATIPPGLRDTVTALVEQALEARERDRPRTGTESDEAGGSRTPAGGGRCPSDLSVP